MATATLNWTNPTTRTDGSTLHASDIASISVFDNGSSTPSTPIATLPGSSTTFTTNALSVGVHGFTLTVTDVEGNTSAASNTASVTVAGTLPPPVAVTNLTATLNP